MTKRRENAILRNRSGAVALPAVLMLSAILVAIGIAMLYSTLTQNDAVYNQSESAAALYASESGVRDAIVKVTRNMNYDSASPYCLMMGDARASIAVTKDLVDGIPALGRTQIISTGTVGVSDCTSAGKYYKKISVVLGISPEGKITINSWKELSI